MSRVLAVPFVDLGLQHRPLAPQLLAQFSATLARGDFVGGAAVERFEAEWAEYCGARHAVGVSSGLDALVIALRALSLGRGFRAAVPALTFVATWEAVVIAGGTPVPVDIREDDYCIDPARVPADDVDVVVPVHLYGRVADMAQLSKLRRLIVEDACQAHGVFKPGRSAAAAFSFYPTKNLGALGDGGALVTLDAGLARRFRELRDHGQRSKHDHVAVGHTARLDTLQAGLLLHKLPHLDAWNVLRQSAAVGYDVLLRGVGDLVLPAWSDEHAWHLYVVRTADPDALAGHLAARGIGSARHYPLPVHLMPAYAPVGHKAGSFPVAERVASEALSLPLYPGLTPAQQADVAAAVTSYFS